jgi:hypothetical protein
MPMIQPPLINGQRLAFASIEPAVNGLPILGRAFTSIDYSDAIARGVVRGAGPLPIGFTRGDYSAEGSLEIPKEEEDLFLAAITANTGRGFLEVSFEVQVSYGGLFEQLSVDHLHGCRLNGTGQSHQRGPDGLVVRFPLYIHYIVHNGRMPLSPDVLVR